MDRSVDLDLEEMARDELARALTLSWRDLSKILPWGDTYDGFSPAGRAVEVERSYLWAEEEGGDILCEVAVYPGPRDYEVAVRVSSLLRKPLIV